MDKLIREWTEQGKDVNEFLNMPFTFVLDILEEKNKPKRVTSVLDLP
ncbi:phage tail assembly chaperone GT [Oceanobacillus neutriphilus]|uniref:Uncharacterized protein n=1 Tax=Oceanobacillus neutriphilus TaxID=531815 RepID=A0ABQ2P3D0_9BACI|nr:hypothetical protein [Oceanobacillus neutriphilus]GGP17253.1 hypothetical protein GCM10011346_52410 [Oceanobacillus neutriphilus]